MASGIPHDPKIRNEGLSAIKAGMTQMESSGLYGIGPNTISTRCCKDVVGGDRNYIAQINHLKRELDNAYRVIGNLSARRQTAQKTSRSG
jgi:hypothetical protein